MLNNRYQILEQLGEGGMGQVYRALDCLFAVRQELRHNYPQPAIRE